MKPSQLLLILFYLTLPGGPASAIELEPGSSHHYRVTRTIESTMKNLGTTTKTKEVYSREMNAVVGEKNDQGLIPVSLNVTRVTGEAPAVNFDTLQVTTKKFDSQTWDGRTAPPAHTFLPYIAQMKKPLTLWFTAEGRLESVTGSKDVNAEVAAMMDRMFRSDPAFESTKAYYRLGYRDSVQQWIWKDRLLFGLPEDFELGSEWEQKDVRVFHMFYVYVKGTFAAVDESADGTEIEVAYDVPGTGKAAVEYGNQKYEYAAKNGTGEGKITVRPDGWLHKAETTTHAYFDVTLHSGPTTVTVAGMTISVGAQSVPFDDYYVRIGHSVERLAD